MQSEKSVKTPTEKEKQFDAIFKDFIDNLSDKFEMDHVKLNKDEIDTFRQVLKLTVKPLFEQNSFQSWCQNMAKNKIMVMITNSNVFKYIDDKKLIEVALEETWKLINEIDWNKKQVNVQKVVEAWLCYRGPSSFGLPNVNEIRCKFICTILPQI